MKKNQNQNIKTKFNEIVEAINTLQQKLETADKESGKDRHDLGYKLWQLKTDKEFRTIYGTFEKLCQEYFHFSRQYGHRLIQLYKIQKALHDEGLVTKETYLGSSMLMTLRRSDKPCEIWKNACEKTGSTEPSEAIVGQIIDEQSRLKPQSRKDMSPEIAKATVDNVCSVLQKIKKANYDPNEAEQKKLIALLKESWSKNSASSAEEVEQEDIA